VVPACHGFHNPLFSACTQPCHDYGACERSATLGCLICALEFIYAGRKAKRAPVPEDNLQEQEMLEAAIEVVAEMQLTADELKVHLI